MPEVKNVKILKKRIFQILNEDETLRQLLGGAGKIYHKQPNKNATYPCVIYSITSDNDFPYNEDCSDSTITKAFIRITIFVRNSGTEIIDDIETRVKTLLHGKRTLDSDEIICYSCYRKSVMEPVRDPDDTTWIQNSRYEAAWALKVE